MPTGAALDLLVEALEQVTGAQAATMLGGQIKDGEALHEVPLQLGADFWGGHLLGHVQLGSITHSILHQMELATLPRDVREPGLPGRLEVGVVINDDAPNSVKATSL